MFSVVLTEKEGYRFAYLLRDGAKSWSGGLRADGELVCDAGCPYRELMLRTLLFKCRNDFVPEAHTSQDWGVDLARFGFGREGDVFRASWEQMRLPHDCGDKE